MVASSQGHTGSAGATAVPPVRSGAAEAFSRLQESTQGRAVSLSKRMQSDLLEMMRSDSASRGIEVELADDDRLDSWRVRYTSFPEGLAARRRPRNLGGGPRRPERRGPWRQQQQRRRLRKLFVVVISAERGSVRRVPDDSAAG